MPSDRATDLAKGGPALALLVIVALALLWAVTNAVVGTLLSTAQRALGGAALMGLFTLSVGYQAVFMLVYPETAVEEEIKPPQTAGSRWADLTPTSTRKARAVGVLGLVGALLGAAITVMLGTAALSGGLG